MLFHTWHTRERQPYFAKRKAYRRGDTRFNRRPDDGLRYFRRKYAERGGKHHRKYKSEKGVLINKINNEYIIFPYK